MNAKRLLFVLLVLRHPLCRDEVRLRLLGSRLGVQGRLPVGFRHRVGLRILG